MASSTLGPQLSFSGDIVSEKTNNVTINNVKMEGQLEVASVFARSIDTLSSSYNEKRRVLEGKSNLKLDSSYLQATNQVSGRYSDDLFSITFRGHMHKLMVNYEIDKQLYFLMDRVIDLLNQYRIKETVQKLTIYLKNIDVKSCFDKAVAFIDDAVKKVQTFDYEIMIKEVNKFLDMVIKKLKSFDYSQFVDDTNNKIREMTQKINEELRNLELPQKSEALKQYLRDFRAVISKYMEQLRDTKLAAIVNWFKELINSTTFANLKAKVNEHLEDLRERISEMDISQEFQWYLQKISQFYNSVVIHISEQWNIAFKKIVALAEEYDLKNWAENLNQFVETGFKVPEIRTVIVTIPALEVSLRSLREATFRTPDFIVPLTDLHIPSYEINIKRLKDMKIPVKFTTPEFTVLNTFKVPSCTIDLNEIKLQIMRTIDKLTSGEFQLPAIDLYCKDLKMRDVPFSNISFPEIQMPQFQIPEFLVPKLNLNELQIPNMKIPEFQLPRIPHTVTVPMFGKLSRAFKVISPFFTLSTQAEVHNTTTSVNSPEFVTSLSAQTTSKLDFLVFSVIADSCLLAPEMKQLNLKNSMKVNHRFLQVDHTNEVIFLGTSVEGEAETRANLYTTKNSIELQNNLMVKLQRKISIWSGTAYSHRLNIPQADFFSQADLVNNVTTEVNAGLISLTCTGKGNWKWASPSFSDEGTHDSLVIFRFDGLIITFSANSRRNDKYLKVSQAMRCECAFPSYTTLQIQSEIESQRVGRSVLNIKGTAQLGGMKVELTGSHNAQLNGRITGTVNNEVDEDIKVQTQQLYKDAMASDYAQKLRSLAEDVKKYISQFKDFSQKTFQDLSEKLRQLLLYVKALWEEYFDLTTLGCSVKYYEVEDKILGWLKNLIDALVDWHNKYIGDLADSVTRLTDHARELVENYSQEYDDLITDVEGKGKQKVMELSSAAQEKIRYWSAAAKRKINEYNKQVKEKLQEIYGQLSHSQEKLISEAKRLIDLTIENCTAFLQYISELLRWFEQTAETIKPYITVRQGELRTDVPKLFDWQSFYQMPQKSREALGKKVEPTRMLKALSKARGSGKKCKDSLTNNLPLSN